MQSNFINIVLYSPEIPQNTGNIARMCVSNDLKLHLVKPLGFELSDKYLKRSGLDYFQYLNYQVYENWENFLELNPEANLWLLSTKGTKIYWDVKFQSNDYLVFGPETRGLPKELLAKDIDRVLVVPMSSDNSRSLNLASTVQTVYYEAFRQLGCT
ncbi:MAG: tRNA (cytidine(34)-2'-O)-methyltransferase [Candidatus Caenarcaniphilales bacterium]|jgi:tRNA (cytidine/uridine-2'-O-)-methyltransferase|nr:tRNA (cytidine(34)-2'-O)-methyltransferase [Candidatus Caenarcaniphilales bacterium]